jgi:hypothetical protein
MESEMKTPAMLVALASLLPAAGRAATIHVNGATGDDTWTCLCAEWDGGSFDPKLTIPARAAS